MTVYYVLVELLGVTELLRFHNSNLIHKMLELFINLQVILAYWFDSIMIVSE